MSNIKTTVQSLWRNTSETAEQQLHAAPLAKTLTAANFWARSPLARARGRRILFSLQPNMIQSNPVSQKWCPDFTFVSFLAWDHRSPSRRSRCCALRVFAVIHAAAWRSCVLGPVAKASLRICRVRFGHEMVLVES